MSREPQPPAKQGYVLSRPREIVVAHDPAAGPLRAIRNVLMQASLNELKSSGQYERYTQLIAPNILAVLLASLAPGWIPVELALAHYHACESLMLTDAELDALGQRVGHRVQETLLVSAAKTTPSADFDLWKALGSLQRMAPRVYQGSSQQVSRLGPKEMLLEYKGLLLHRFRYYRVCHLAVLRATYSAMGARVSEVTILKYDKSSDSLTVLVAWA